jgi:hypothetical protein
MASRLSRAALRIVFPSSKFPAEMRESIKRYLQGQQLQMRLHCID